MAYPMTNSTTLSRREMKKRDKRQRLLTESLRLFRERGFEQTKVSDITRAAGVAKGTFFNYFPTKERILLALGEQILGQMRQVEAMELFSSGSTRGKIKGLFHALSSGLDTNQELVREMVYQGLRLPDLINGDRSRMDFRSMLILVIEHGKRQKEITPKVDAKFVADTLYMLYFQQVVNWCIADFTTSLPNQLDRVVDLVFDGVATPKFDTYT